MRVVTRNVNSAKSKLQYPGLEFYSLSQIADAVKGADAVVNLAGEPIGTRCVVELTLVFTYATSRFSRALYTCSCFHDYIRKQLQTPRNPFPLHIRMEGLRAADSASNGLYMFHTAICRAYITHGWLQSLNTVLVLAGGHQRSRSRSSSHVWTSPGACL